MGWHPNWVSVGISGLALAASAWVAYTSYISLVVGREAQQIALFTQFEQEFTAVAARFPPRIYDPDFRPERGSDDYKRVGRLLDFLLRRMVCDQQNELVCLP